MTIVRHDPTQGAPRRLTGEEQVRLDALDDQRLTANARSDPDNPPLTEDELDRIEAVKSVRLARQKAGLSQAAFATAFHINLGRLRDLEQGRTRPDSAILAYLRLIARDPDYVLRALAA